MKTVLSIIVVLFLFNSAQSQSALYGLLKTPGGSGGTKKMYLASIDPLTGNVSVIGQQLPYSTLGLGNGGLSTFDFIDDLYYYASLSNFSEVDVQTGNQTQVTINPSSCNIASPQFACNDLSLYGFDRCGTITRGFGKYDLNAGTFNPKINLSSSPTENYTYDKMNNKYIFWDNNNSLYTINLSNLQIDTFSIPTIVSLYFNYPEYNCNDSCIYGIKTVAGGNGLLAKYNMYSNVFTTLSSFAFPVGGAWPAGRALDINNGLYYYNNGSSILSIRLSDGRLVNNKSYISSLPGSFTIYYIKIDQTCYCEVPLAANELSNNIEPLIEQGLDFLSINFETNHTSTFRLFDISSRLVQENTFQNNLTIQTDEFPTGLYIYQINSDGKQFQGKIRIGN